MSWRRGGVWLGSGWALAMAVLIAILALGGIGTAAASVGSTAVSVAGFPSGPGNPGIFTEGCRFSHEAADDPILMPGRPGQAMHHDFFGNVGTDASSTAASLRGGASTCATSADASAYWVPVLYQSGQPIVPRRALIYWRRVRHDHAPVHSLPAGLEMIAGDEHAMAPQGVDRVGWSCVGASAGTGSRVDQFATPHSCAVGQHLRLTVAFPSCWNGHTLNGASQSNVAYRIPGRHGGCPAGYPVQIPQIVFHVIYPISSAAHLSLSMGPHMTGSTDTAHADFIDGWNAPILARDVRACLATSTRCGPVRGPEAVPQGPRPR